MRVGYATNHFLPKRSDYVVPDSFFFAILAEKTLRESKAPDSTWPKNNARCSVAWKDGVLMGASPTKNTLFEENWSFKVAKWCR